MTEKEIKRVEKMMTAGIERLGSDLRNELRKDIQTEIAALEIKINTGQRYVEKKIDDQKAESAVTNSKLDKISSGIDRANKLLDGDPDTGYPGLKREFDNAKPVIDYYRDTMDINKQIIEMFGDVKGVWRAFWPFLIGVFIAGGVIGSIVMLAIFKGIL